MLSTVREAAMARIGAAPAAESTGLMESGADGRRPQRRLPSVKVWLLGAVVISLVALFSFALGRELAPRGETSAARPTVPTPRPALTQAEEAYSLALWPTHNRVKESAIRMTLAGINFKLRKLDGVAFGGQVRSGLGVYQEAEGQVRALQPPPSLQSVHDSYLQAVILYQKAGTEMLKVLDDQDEEHLRTAFPFSQEGGQRLRQVGAVLWPTEYVPS
jgi:hypothetical protein